MHDASVFRKNLSTATGLTQEALDAAWPEWWSDVADASPSAQAELRFSLARKLGLDPTALIEDAQPRFIWNDAAKYKNFAGDADREQPAITSFGVSVGKILIFATPEVRPIFGMTASDIRRALLFRAPFIRLEDLLSFLWGVGTPVAHLRVHPLSAKRMHAMALRDGNRSAILVAKDASYPASTVFHLAHEIGHISLGHVPKGGGIVDMEPPSGDDQDNEELAADRFALELLTGSPDLTIEKIGQGRSAKALAGEALKVGPENNIEPGTLALCYGYSTGEWDTANAALRHIYAYSAPIWETINQVANHQLNWQLLSDDNASYLRAILGGMHG